MCVWPESWAAGRVESATEQDRLWGGTGRGTEESSDNTQKSDVRVKHGDEVTWPRCLWGKLKSEQLGRSCKYDSRLYKHRRVLPGPLWVWLHTAARAVHTVTGSSIFIHSPGGDREAPPPQVHLQKPADVISPTQTERSSVILIKLQYKVQSFHCDPKSHSSTRQPPSAQCWTTWSGAGGGHHTISC